MKKLSALFAAAAVAALPVYSQAAAMVIDTAEATGQITEGKTAAGTIGMAMIAFVVLVGVLVKTRRAGS